MGYTKLPYNRPTSEFSSYITKKIKDFAVCYADGEKASNVEYEAWDDSDQPGFDERVTFTLGGRTFQAAMTHNRWQSFKEIK